MPTHNPPNHGTGKRVGLAILKVFAQYALRSIPVYGVYAEFGWDLINAVRQEIGTTRPLTVDEMADHLRPLTNAEAQKMVDSVLQSPDGRRLTAGVPEAQVRQLRDRLVRLPSEFDQILAVIDLHDSREAARAAESARVAERNRQKQQNEIADQLKVTLKTELKNKEFEKAYKTVERILGLRPNDQEVLRVQAWLDRKLGRGVLRSVLIGAAIAGAIGMLPANGMRGDMAASVIGVFAAIGALIGLISGLKRKASRWRKLRH